MERIEKTSSHKDLVVWKKAMDFVVKVYSITGDLPTREMYGLTSQMRRSAISIPSNIAEGSARRNTKEFIQFLYIAQGSLAEIETQFEICQRIGYVTNISEIQNEIKSIRVLISKLVKALQNKLQTNQ